MFMSREHNAQQNHNINIGNKSFEHVEQFKNLGKKIASKNFMHEEIKITIYLGNVRYHSIQKRCLPFCYLKIRQFSFYAITFSASSLSRDLKTYTAFRTYAIILALTGFGIDHPWSSLSLCRRLGGSDITVTP
jgi:hypothetical protein